MKPEIFINVSGPDKSGKGHVIAAIARILEGMGAELTVQLGDTHNRPKLEKTDEELARRLEGVRIAITEQQI